MSTTKLERLSKGAGPDPGRAAGMAPEDSFLVQIGGSSRPAERAIRGRIEHLHSGTSEQFGSLTELLDFLARHFGAAGHTVGFESCSGSDGCNRQ